MDNSGIDNSMTREIIALIPSDDLKVEIQRRNHCFTEEELLQIAYTYAPTFDKRLSLLERISAIASAEISALSKAYIDYETANYNRFLNENDGFVYELCIKETPISYEEKYLCSTYEDAQECIDRFYLEYKDIDAKETPQTHYRIIKRKVFSKSTAFEEDAYAECVLGANKTVLEVSDYKNPADCDLDIMCDKCKEICPRRYIEVNYPDFAQNYSIIRYLDYDRKECLGVNICLDDECGGLASEYYVVPFDSRVIREHLYDADFYDHEHIALPLATLASVDDLDETTKKDYLDFITYLDSQKQRN